MIVGCKFCLSDLRQLTVICTVHTEPILHPTKWRVGHSSNSREFARKALTAVPRTGHTHKAFPLRQRPKKQFWHQKRLYSRTCCFLFCLLPGPSFVDKIQSHCILYKLKSAYLWGQQHAKKRILNSVIQYNAVDTLMGPQNARWHRS